MKQRTVGRQILYALVSSALLLAGLVASSLAAEEEHPVAGRWVVEAEPGGAVWAFRPSGALIVTGPGEISSEGTWIAAEEAGAFDARLAVEVSGQELEVLGQVADDGSAVALYAVATEATRPDDWTPWPAESRLLGYPLGMMVEATPPPTEPPLECFRPLWDGGAVDWNRCDEVTAAE
jgi:hypothetical protein